jgi:hypothetical protein
MKILTKKQLDWARQLAMAADALVSQAEAIVRNAHRTWWLRACLKSAQNSLVTAVAELEHRTYYDDPPRTRKVERMERMEREREERNMKRVTMGGSSTGQGPASQLPSGGCRAGEKEPKKVKE